MTIRLPLLYFSIVVLIVALVVQLAQWKRASETESGLARKESTSIGTKHQKWSEQVSDAEERRRRLETQLLWSEPESLLPAVATLSEGLSISLVGVERLQERRGGDYVFHPLRLTFSGDYGAFASLLDVAERIEPAARIEEMRLYRRKRGAETLWLDLTLAAMHKGDEGGSDLKPVGVAGIFTVNRNPFAFVSPMPQSGIAAGRANDTPLPKLTGILWDDANPLSLWVDGGKTLSAGVGDTVSGVTILSIQSRKVVVTHGARQYEWGLWKP